jgi:hypothetical protein
MPLDQSFTLYHDDYFILFYLLFYLNYFLNKFQKKNAKHGQKGRSFESELTDGTLHLRDDLKLTSQKQKECISILKKRILFKKKKAKTKSVCEI